MSLKQRKSICVVAKYDGVGVGVSKRVLVSYDHDNLVSVLGECLDEVRVVVDDGVVYGCVVDVFKKYFGGVME